MSKGVYFGFEIEDSGVGISDSDKTHLFEEFGMGLSQVNINKHGTGLGLSICKKLVKLLGGDIRIKSVLGVGTIS